jgi:hypothetical protein
MTREENVFWAKRNIVDYIWKSAKLEGLSVTFPETDAIFNGMSVANVRVEEVIAVNNLKRAWQFVLENLDYPIDYPYICKINQIVGGDNLIFGAGYIRNFPVSIGGTAWKPDLPIEAQIIAGLSDVAAIDTPTERAITLMMYIMRKQMFSDGNKRTAMLAANQIMVSSGCGIISVPIEKQPEFTKMLVGFYESGDIETIKAFVYNECVDGADISSIYNQPLPDMSCFNIPGEEKS